MARRNSGGTGDNRRRTSGGVVNTVPTGAVSMALALSGASTVTQAGTGALSMAMGLSGLGTYAGSGALSASMSLSGSSTVSQAGTGSTSMSMALSGTGTFPTGSVALGTSGNVAYGTGPLAIALTGVGSSSVICVCVNTNNSGVVTSITDNASTNYTWSQIVSQRPASGVYAWSEQWQGVGGSGGNVTVTVHITAATNGTAAAIELTNCGATPVQSSGGTTAAPGVNTITSSSLTPSISGCLMLSMCASGDGIDVFPGGSWTTTSFNHPYDAWCYQASLTSGTAYSNTWHIADTLAYDTTCSALFQP